MRDVTAALRSTCKLQIVPVNTLTAPEGPLTAPARRRFSARKATLFAAVAAAGLLASGLVVAHSAAADDHGFIPCEPSYDGPLNCIPDEPGQQFVWPVTAWIGANHEYASGSDHSASADLSAQLDSAVYPARAGVVSAKTYEQADGWRIQIKHEGDDGDEYISSYSHLLAEPTLAVGADVDLDTEIGRLGRLGNADASGPHVHFYIAKLVDGDTERIRIPQLEIGDWAERGAHIHGEFTGLDPTAEPDSPELDVEVAEADLRAYEATNRSPDEIVAELDVGDEFEVLESHRGQYRVDVDGELAWIPHSGTVPAGSTLSGVKSTASSTGHSNVRTGPGESHDVIGVVPGGTHLTSYPHSDADTWRVVLWRCNSDTNRSEDSDDVDRALGGCPGLDSGNRWKYGWVGPAVTEETPAFDSRSRIDGLGVYANQNVDGEDQPDPDDRIGSAGGFTASFHVLNTRNGWYQIEFDDGVGWVRGWHTAGRQ